MKGFKAWRLVVAGMLMVPAGLLATSALDVASSGAATLTCPNFSETGLNPPPGDTAFFFIGTSISTDTSSITVVTSGGTIGPVAGTQAGNGSFHYVVFIPQGDTVISATVTGATDTTTITVSGCEQGAIVTTTSSTTTTTTTTTTPTSTTTKAVSPAVVIAPKLTG